MSKRSEIKIVNVPRIKVLITELTYYSNQRQDCLDRLWILENEGEKRRQELMHLLNP